MNPEQENSVSLKWFGLPRLLPWLKPHKMLFFWMISLGLYGGVIDFVLPLFQQYAINNFVAKGVLDGLWAFIGVYMRLSCLRKLGAWRQALADVRGFFGAMNDATGTLWENRIIDTSSRCHGFTSHAGVHLMRDVLGLSFPLFDEGGEGDAVLEISPHVCGLRWARGTRETPEGIVSVDWRYDGESFTLRVNTPAAYDCRVVLPKEAAMLDEARVSVIVTKY